MIREIYPVAPRERGCERNYFTIESYEAPDGVAVELSESSLVDLSLVFHDEFVKRLSLYLIDGDKIEYTDNKNSNCGFYPLDAIFHRDTTVYARNALFEVLATVKRKSISDVGFMSDIIDSHLKTLLIAIAQKRPGNVNITFAPSDTILWNNSENKSLYAFLHFELRSARLETEMSLSVNQI